MSFTDTECPTGRDDREIHGVTRSDDQVLDLSQTLALLVLHFLADELAGFDLLAVFRIGWFGTIIFAVYNCCGSEMQFAWA